MPGEDFSYTQIPNIIFDHWMSVLTAEQFKVLLCICRKTIGWHKNQDSISHSQIERMTGISRRSVIRSVKILIGNDLIEKTISTSEYGDNNPNLYRIKIMFGSASQTLPSVPQTRGGSAPQAPTKATLTKEIYKEASREGEGEGEGGIACPSFIPKSKSEEEPSALFACSSIKARGNPDLPLTKEAIIKNLRDSQAAFQRETSALGTASSIEDQIKKCKSIKPEDKETALAYFKCNPDKFDKAEKPLGLLITIVRSGDHLKKTRSNMIRENKAWARKEIDKANLGEQIFFDKFNISVSQNSGMPDYLIKYDHPEFKELITSCIKRKGHGTKIPLSKELQ